MNVKQQNVLVIVVAWAATVLVIAWIVFANVKTNQTIDCIDYCWGNPAGLQYNPDRCVCN